MADYFAGRIEIGGNIRPVELFQECSQAAGRLLLQAEIEGQTDIVAVDPVGAVEFPEIQPD